MGYGRVAEEETAFRGGFLRSGLVVRVRSVVGRPFAFLFVGGEGEGEAISGIGRQAFNDEMWPKIGHSRLGQLRSSHTRRMPSICR